jgi:hypothetical protein
MEVVVRAGEVVDAEGLGQAHVWRLAQRDINLAEIFHRRLKPSVGEYDIVQDVELDFEDAFIVVGPYSLEEAVVANEIVGGLVAGVNEDYCVE